MSAAQNAGAETGRHMRHDRTQPSESPLLGAFLQQRDRLRRIAAGMGLAGADIDDVLQDVSMQVLRHTDRFEQEGRMTAWLIRTTANRCLLEHRRRFRRKVSGLVERRPDLGRVSTAGTPAVADRAAVAEELEIVRRTMAELDPSLLEPLVLRYFCDLDSTEIGETLGLNASTVRSRLREARMILAEKLMRRGVEP
jgi:RNA polymerase sigma-70 factor (ECF subfamily)